MSLLRARAFPMVARLVHLRPTFTRSLATARPLRVSGYGVNAPNSMSKDQAAVPDVEPTEGGQVPRYSGPSIEEKRTGKPADLESEGRDMKNQRDEEFENNQFESARPLKNDGSDWDGKIRAPRSDLQNGKIGSVGAKAPAPKRSSKLGADAERRDWEMKRGISTKSSKQAKRNVTITESLKDDAAMFRDSAKNKLHKAKLSADEVATDIKESAQKAWKKTKKAAMNATDKLEDVTEKAMQPMYPDAAPNAELYPTADSLQDKGGVRLPMASPEAAASATGASLGEDMDGLRKGFFDGPQSMPQGPGKRAKNEKGMPLETGTRGS